MLSRASWQNQVLTPRASKTSVCRRIGCVEDYLGSWFLLFARYFNSPFTQPGTTSTDSVLSALSAQGGEKDHMPRNTWWVQATVSSCIKPSRRLFGRSAPVLLEDQNLSFAGDERNNNDVVTTVCITWSTDYLPWPSDVACRYVSPTFWCGTNERRFYISSK